MLSAFLASSTRGGVRAHSSAVEHSPYKRGVTGSKPVAPTSTNGGFPGCLISELSDYALPGGKIRFIEVAASSMTGRSCLRHTVSVTVVVWWPTSRAMFSSGTPSSDSSETKLWRSSRGVHSFVASPALVTTWRNLRRTLCLSSGVPA